LNYRSQNCLRGWRVRESARKRFCQSVYRGHRANFIVIRDGRAEAHYDQWAALGSILKFADGPESASQELNKYSRTTELLSWCYAEGGYLIDFDERLAIVFGPTVDLEEFADEDGKINDKLQRELEPFAKEGIPYLSHIAGKWSGWKLIWDDHGVDAFAAHLKARKITGIETQHDSHPPETEKPVKYQA
jgi:hypothetical protein